MLKLSISNYRQTEIQWVCNVIFSEMLGVEIEFQTSNEKDFILSDGAKSLSVANIFLSETQENWLTSESLPNQNLQIWKPKNFPDFPDFLTDATLPILFGTSHFYLTENKIELGLDVFGTAFFMLSRYEELVITERDKFNRFPASASLAFKENFILRPIVDEYVEILWQCIKKLFPTIKRQHRKGKVLVTCDVDAPYDVGLKNPKFLFRELMEDIFKRGNFKIATLRCINIFARCFGNFTFDPNNTFDWYMDVCEKNGLIAAFYFICANTAGKIDGCYNLEELEVQTLLKKINARGHEIGMHASFNTFDNAKQLQTEREKLLATCANLGIVQKILGNRQHFLRFDVQQTPQYLEHAGFQYDATGGFADCIGFRFGTAHTFSMWDWQTHQAMQLQQKPLIAMEVSVFNYMKCDHSDETLQKLVTLKNNALRYGGNFTLLWHNDKFLNRKDKSFFEKLISFSV